MSRQHVHRLFAVSVLINCRKILMIGLPRRCAMPFTIYYRTHRLIKVFLVADPFCLYTDSPRFSSSGHASATGKITGSNPRLGCPCAPVKPKKIDAFQKTSARLQFGAEQRRSTPPLRIAISERFRSKRKPFGQLHNGSIRQVTFDESEAYRKVRIICLQISISQRKKETAVTKREGEKRLASTI